MAGLGVSDSSFQEKTQGPLVCGVAATALTTRGRFCDSECIASRMALRPLARARLLG